MKLRTIALATLFALSSTFALAEENPATGAQGGATGAPVVKTNPTPEAQGGGTPGAKTADQATSSTTGASTSGSANQGTNGSNPVESDKVNSGTPTGPTPIK